MYLYLIFIALLVVISYYDIKTNKIPNFLLIILAAISVCSFLFNGKISLYSAVFGALFMFIFLYVIRILSAKGIGGGDIKLMTVCGFMLGIGNGLYALLIGSIIAGIYVIVVMRSRTKDLKAKIAFGPFLSIGVTAVIVFSIFKSYK